MNQKAGNETNGNVRKAEKQERISGEQLRTCVAIIPVKVQPAGYIYAPIVVVRWCRF
jgi:hypothetical protein